MRGIDCTGLAFSPDGDLNTYNFVKIDTENAIIYIIEI
jgi:hypothetical protein